MNTTLLIVDDELNVLRTLERALEMEGFAVLSAASGSEALRVIDRADLVLTDMSMPGMDGLELLLEIKKRRPDLPVAMMTAYASVDGALAAMQQGAYDYLLKPCQSEEITLKVKLGLRLSRYEHELRVRNEELERTKLRLEEANQRLERLATTDPLTDLPNRRRFIERLEEETETAHRYKHATSLILLDLDHFKRVNDNFGHPAGDRVLVEVARILKERARAADLPARLGGEEFAILVPFTNEGGACELAEDMRVRIEQHVFEGIGHVTASFGVAELDTSAGSERRLLSEADAALYRAKAAGRNRVTSKSQ
jgi:diguanylate cyclase (GGDEF)-like protein